MTATTLAPSGLMDGFGTARRLQALYRWGWPFEAQAENCVLSAAELAALTEPTPVSFAVATAVEDLYDELAMKLPPATLATGQVRADGERRGWALPLEWDDDEIDDPAAIPATIAPLTVAASKAWMVNYAVLARRGLARRQIAETLGTTPTSIKDRLIRARAGGYLPPELDITRRPVRSNVRPCGTRAAYLRHKHRGEPVDEACRAARNAYDDGRRRAAAQCGSTGAYMRHKRRNEPVDDACQQAWRAYYQAYERPRTVRAA